MLSPGGVLVCFRENSLSCEEVACCGLCRFRRWSFGITAFYLSTGKLPFSLKPSMSFKKQRSRICKKSHDWPKGIHVSEHLKSLTRACLKKRVSCESFASSLSGFCSELPSSASSLVTELMISFCKRSLSHCPLRARRTVVESDTWALFQHDSVLNATPISRSIRSSAIGTFGGWKRVQYSSSSTRSILLHLEQ